jgi:hypothetical protein
VGERSGAADGLAREPAWAWWLAGLLAYVCAGRPAWSPPALAAGDLERWAPRDDPRRMAVRDLRRLPGVGDRRAAAAAEARWRQRADGGALAWSDVPGIGAITAARVEAWQRAQGLPVELAREPPDGRAPAAAAKPAGPMVAPATRP